MRAPHSHAQAVMDQPELGLGMPTAWRATTRKPGQRPCHMCRGYSHAGRKRRSHALKKILLPSLPPCRTSAPAILLASHVAQADKRAGT